MTILCYHSVRDDWDWRFALARDNFATHCRWLRDRRTPVGLAESLPRVSRTGRLPGRMVALSFDDGFRDVYETAWPVMMRYELPVTVFLVARTLVEDDPQVDWVPGGTPETVRVMTASQVLELHSAGVMFGSHGYSHLPLTALSEEECEQELRTSREIIEDVLHDPVRLVAYPHGQDNEMVRRAARNAGYAFGLRTARRATRTSKYSIPRVGIYRSTDTRSLRVKLSRWTQALYSTRAVGSRRPPRTGACS